MNQPDLRLLLLPRAEIDIAEQADYIAEDSLDSALRFFDNAQTTFQFLCRNPEAGSVQECYEASLKDVRVWPVAGFENWLVFYQVCDSDLVVLRVLHGARDIDKLFGRQL